MEHTYEPMPTLSGAWTCDLIKVTRESKERKLDCLLAFRLRCGPVEPLCKSRALPPVPPLIKLPLPRVLDDDDLPE